MTTTTTPAPDRRPTFHAVAVLTYDPADDTLYGYPDRPNVRRPLVRAQRLG